MCALRVSSKDSNKDVCVEIKRRVLKDYRKPQRCLERVAPACSAGLHHEAHIDLSDQRQPSEPGAKEAGPRAASK